jgi:hypothetical protein
MKTYPTPYHDLNDRRLHLSMARNEIWWTNEEGDAVRVWLWSIIRRGKSSVKLVLISPSTGAGKSGTLIHLRSPERSLVGRHRDRS